MLVRTDRFAGVLRTPLLCLFVIPLARRPGTAPMTSYLLLPSKLERWALATDAEHPGAAMRSRIGSNAFALIASYAPTSLIRALTPVGNAKVAELIRDNVRGRVRHSLRLHVDRPRHT